MDFAIPLAILASIAAIATAIKGLPIILDGIKRAKNAVFSWLKGLSNLPQAAQIPTLAQVSHRILDSNSEILDSINRFSEELHAHMEEEERLRNEEKALVEQMAEAVEVLVKTSTRASFRQSTFASDVAYFELAWNEERNDWDFTWANRAWSKLTGLSINEAQNGGHWWVIHPDDVQRVREVSLRAAQSGDPIEIEFKIVNSKTGAIQVADMISFPYYGMDTKVDGYFGALHAGPIQGVDLRAGVTVSQSVDPG